MKQAPTIAILFLVVLAILIQGCATTSATKEGSSAYVPSFDFTPPTTAAPGSADVVFAIVNASYAENQPWMQVWPFTDVSRNMGNDFQEIVSARGFNVRGPFATYDEITFPDKKASDLVLVPTLEIRLDIISPQVKKHINILGPDSYTVNGQAAVSGRVTLSLMESLSKERMWFKSVELQRTVVPFEGEKEYTAPPAGVDPSDPGISKPLGTTMETFYKKVMQAAWNYLDPEEMKIVKKQAEEIKKKKVY